MEKTQVLSSLEVLERLQLREKKSGPRAAYAAMYSSWVGGITTDPSLMLIPIDDHGFHRGDAVFEAAKCVKGKIYALDLHLARMVKSGEAIGLNLPKKVDELKAIAIAAVHASGLQDCLLRYYVSRGPGGFSPNPYESVGAQVYLVITTLKPLPPAKYEKGVSAKVSSIHVKEGFFANVKSCNYLPNVLMKKEAVDQGVDFTVSVDERGFLAEGSTENFAIISRDGEFLVPGFERTLKGITVSRMMELALPLVKSGMIKAVRHAQLTRDDVLQAKEAMFLGTTLDCLPVTVFDGKVIGGNGQIAGIVARAFQAELLRDIASGPLALQT